MDANTNGTGAGANTDCTGAWVFINDLFEILGCGSDGDDFALVTGTLDYASGDGSGVSSQLGICYQASGSSTVNSVGHVQPEFTAPADSYFAQSVSGVIGKVGCDFYTVGLCTDCESSNVLHGLSLISVLVGHPSNGGTPAAVTVGAAGSQPAHNR